MRLAPRLSVRLSSCASRLRAVWRRSLAHDQTAGPEPRSNRRVEPGLRAAGGVAAACPTKGRRRGIIRGGPSLHGACGSPIFSPRRSTPQPRTVRFQDVHACSTKARRIRARRQRGRRLASGVSDAATPRGRAAGWRRDASRRRGRGAAVEARAGGLRGLDAAAASATAARCRGVVVAAWRGRRRAHATAAAAARRRGVGRRAKRRRSDGTVCRGRRVRLWGARRFVRRRARRLDRGPSHLVE